MVNTCGTLYPRAEFSATPTPNLKKMEFHTPKQHGNPPLTPANGHAPDYGVGWPVKTSPKPQRTTYYVTLSEPLTTLYSTFTTKLLLKPISPRPSPSG